MATQTARRWDVMKTCAVSGASDVVLGSKPSVIIVVDLVRNGGVSAKHHFW
jgi:hypothetical protein